MKPIITPQGCGNRNFTRPCAPYETFVLDSTWRSGQSPPVRLASIGSYGLPEGYITTARSTCSGRTSYDTLKPTSQPPSRSAVCYPCCLEPLFTRRLEDRKPNDTKTIIAQYNIIKSILIQIKTSNSAYRITVKKHFPPNQYQQLQHQYVANHNNN